MTFTDDQVWIGTAILLTPALIMFGVSIGLWYLETRRDARQPKR